MGPPGLKASEVAGKKTVPSRQVMKKLSPLQIKEIKQRSTDGEASQALAEDFNVSFKTIENLLRGSTYQGQGRVHRRQGPKPRYSLQDKLAIAEAYLGSNRTTREVAKIFRCSPDTVSRFATLHKYGALKEDSHI